MDWSEAESDQVVIDDAKIVPIEIAPYDRDERRRDGRDRPSTFLVSGTDVQAGADRLTEMPGTVKVGEALRRGGAFVWDLNAIEMASPPVFSVAECAGAVAENLADSETPVATP